MNNYFTFPKHVCRFTLFRSEYCGSPSAAPKDLNLQKPRDCATNLIWTTSDKYWSNFKYNCKYVLDNVLCKVTQTELLRLHTVTFLGLPRKPFSYPLTLYHADFPSSLPSSNQSHQNHIKIRSFSFPYLEQELLGEKGCEVPNTCMCTSAQKMWQLLGKSCKPVVSFSLRGNESASTPSLPQCSCWLG